MAAIRLFSVAMIAARQSQQGAWVGVLLEEDNLLRS
jgi:hypothetical protein